MLLRLNDGSSPLILCLPSISAARLASAKRESELPPPLAEPSEALSTDLGVMLTEGRRRFPLEGLRGEK